MDFIFHTGSHRRKSKHLFAGSSRGEFLGIFGTHSSILGVLEAAVNTQREKCSGSYACHNQ
jgi:hypothetical protein